MSSQYQPSMNLFGIWHWQHGCMWLIQSNKKTRNAAYDLLIEIGHGMEDEETGGSKERLLNFFTMVWWSLLILLTSSITFNICFIHLCFSGEIQVMWVKSLSMPRIITWLESFCRFISSWNLEALCLHLQLAYLQLHSKAFRFEC